MRQLWQAAAGSVLKFKNSGSENWFVFAAARQVVRDVAAQGRNALVPFFRERSCAQYVMANTRLAKQADA